MTIVNDQASEVSRSPEISDPDFLAMLQACWTKGYQRTYEYIGWQRSMFAQYNRHLFLKEIL